MRSCACSPLPSAFFCFCLLSPCARRLSVFLWSRAGQRARKREAERDTRNGKKTEGSSFVCSLSAVVPSIPAPVASAFLSFSSCLRRRHRTAPSGNNNKQQQKQQQPAIETKHSEQNWSVRWAAPQGRRLLKKRTDSGRGSSRRTAGGKGLGRADRTISVIIRRCPHSPRVLCVLLSSLLFQSSPF